MSPDEATTPRAGKPPHPSTDGHFGTGSGFMSKDREAGSALLTSGGALPIGPAAPYRLSNGGHQIARPLGKYGRAVTAGDGLLHIERDERETYCGKPIGCYPLHWDKTTVIACGSCLIAAGVPLRKAAP